jgi:imidazolonepropionase-like amidohydrolase
MRVTWTIVAVVLLGSCARGGFHGAAPPALTAGDLWIRDVTVISPEAQPRPGSHVIVRKGRIAAVATEAPRGLTSGVTVTVLSGAGKFLTAGLIDGHVHLAGVPGMSPEQEALHPELVSAYYEQLPRSYLYFGFTTVVDLSVVDRTRLDRLERAPAGPMIFDCDGGLALANGYPMAYLPPAVRFTRYPNFLYDERQTGSIPTQFTAADHSPSAAVARVVRAGGVCVKAYYEPGFGEQAGKLPVPTTALMREVSAAARAAGLPLLLHANSLEAHRFAAAAGADVVVHGLWNWNQPEAAGGAIPEAVQQVLSAARSGGVRMMPTARVVGGLGDLFAPEFLEDPQLTRVLPMALIAWYRGPEGQWFAREISQSLRGLPPAGARQILQNLQSRGTRAAAQFARDGGRLIFGSDTPSGPTYANPPGYNGFLELTTLEAAGIAPRQLLVAATTDAARLFGLSRDYGTVEAGKVANLLLLSADPLASVSAFDKIDPVIVGGRAIERATLAAGR